MVNDHILALMAQYTAEADEAVRDAQLLDAEAAIIEARAAGCREHAQFLRDCVEKLQSVLLYQDER